MQAGGGNVSIKDSEGLWIKKSGMRLRDVKSINDFLRVNINRNDILKLCKGRKCNRDLERRYEALIYSKSAGAKKFKPSIELSFHTLTAKYTLHTHPVKVNTFSCSREGQQILSKMHKQGKIACVSYQKPGIFLTNHMIRMLKVGRSSILPAVLILMNHGMIVSSDNIERIPSLTDDFMHELDAIIPPPHFESINVRPDKHDDQAKKIKKSFQKNRMAKEVRYIGSYPEFSCDAKTKESYAFSQKVLYPDYAVYCGSHILSLQAKANTISKKNILDFVCLTGHYPKLIYLSGGLYAVGQNSDECELIQEVFLSHLKVLRNISELGWKPVFLRKKECQALIHWDAEKYRQRLVEK
ncbi:MAG: class II aldolase/adducin family protein [Candidatus Omnitrophica bacterium]|nr:class II aldolase/adducin family protein [Candidatus Omnitrophota bacterium]